MSAVASVLGLLLVGSFPLGLVSHPVIAEVASIDDPDAPDDDVQSADAPLSDIELPDAYREPDPVEPTPLTFLIISAFGASLSSQQSTPTRSRLNQLGR